MRLIVRCFSDIYVASAPELSQDLESFLVLILQATQSQPRRQMRFHAVSVLILSVESLFL